MLYTIFYFCTNAGGITSSDVMKEESALYGSPGAGLVSMGDQEEGGNLTGTSSWGQFPNGRLSLCVNLVPYLIIMVQL